MAPAAIFLGLAFFILLLFRGQSSRILAGFVSLFVMDKTGYVKQLTV